jgi:hypothetical protein
MWDDSAYINQPLETTIIGLGVAGTTARAAKGEVGWPFSNPLTIGENRLLAFGGDHRAIGRGVFELAAMAVPASKLRYVDTVGDVSRAARATQLARELGAAGKRMSGITGPKAKIPSLTGTANYRIPDELTTTYLREAKNVAELRVTPQLIDYGEFARRHNLTFILDVRKTTVVGPKAQQFIQQYNVQLNRLYPAP